MNKFYFTQLNEKYGFNLQNEFLPFMFTNLNNTSEIKSAQNKVENIWNVFKSIKCPVGAIPKFAFPRGNINSRIMIVAQNPGGKGAGDYTTIWNDGPNSKYFLNVVSKSGIFNDVWFTNLVPHATIDNKINKTQINSVVSLFELQLEIIKPSVVVGLGSIVNSSLRDILGLSIPLVELKHPAYVRRFLSGNEINKLQYVEDFRCVGEYLREENIGEKIE